MLTAERLRQVLDYNPETGAFTWKVARGRGVRPGDVAGARLASGYRHVTVGNRPYRAHRLAWLYVYGEWPTNQIDHINGNRADNRISNLRQATNGENLQNQRRAHSGNTSGFLGVSWDAARKAWRAQIKEGGATRHLGRFASPEAAHDAYLAAKRRLHEFGTI